MKPCWIAGSCRYSRASGVTPPNRQMSQGTHAGSLPLAAEAQTGAPVRGSDTTSRARPMRVMEKSAAERPLVITFAVWK